jgi:hypothetical protein
MQSQPQPDGGWPNLTFTEDKYSSLGGCHCYDYDSDDEGDGRTVVGILLSKYKIIKDLRGRLAPTRFLRRAGGSVRRTTD